MVNTILKEADLFCPNSVRINFIIYHIKSAFKRLGIGRALINYAFDQAKSLSKEYIWLGVWEHNPAALAFYKKLGFLAFSDHRFNLGGDLQRDVLMKKTLGIKP